jgi:hypothetical protein
MLDCPYIAALCANNTTTEYGGSCIFESNYGNEGVGSCRYNSPEEIKLREYVYQVNAAAAAAATSGKQCNSVDDSTACVIPTAVNSPCYDSSSSSTNATKHKHAQTHTVAAAALKASAHGSNSNSNQQHQQRVRSLSDADTTANSSAATATSTTRESRSSKSTVQQRALSKSPTPAAAEATRQRASAAEVSQAISAERSSLHRSSHNKQ